MAKANAPGGTGCLGCGRRAETLHHVVPVSVAPARELDPTNHAPVCVPCHFCVAHLGSWNTYDPDALVSLVAHRVRVRAAAKCRPAGT